VTGVTKPLVPKGRHRVLWFGWAETESKFFQSMRCGTGRTESALWQQSFLALNLLLKVLTTSLLIKARLHCIQAEE